MTPKNIHKIFRHKKIFIFLKTPKNIDIQNFKPKIMTQAYVCIKISEYPPPPPPPGKHLSSYQNKDAYKIHIRGKFLLLWPLGTFAQVMRTNLLGDVLTAILGQSRRKRAHSCHSSHKFHCTPHLTGVLLAS